MAPTLPPTMMEQTMRWFGPTDPVSLTDLRQAGCTGVVTALHDIKNGDVWPVTEISKRKADVESQGLHWSVVESLPVHEDIKTQAPGFETYIKRYQQSLRNLASCGVTTVTYNFMPLLDWTRTDSTFVLDDGSIALRFDMIDVAVYDLHILQRPQAQQDYSAEVLKLAAEKVASLNEDNNEAFERTIVAGLPGSEESFSRQEFLTRVMRYQNIGASQYKQHLIHFLREVCPVADEVGVQLVIHPDDPPFPLFGLPRVVSTAKDLRELFDAVPNGSNGLCFCVGSLSIRDDNNLPGMIHEFGERIRFIHLRNTQREAHGSFYESNHLEGSVDMFEVVSAIVDISESLRVSIPMRPDHGHQILDDQKKHSKPGYSAIGRLKGLAELRGLEYGIVRSRD